MPPIARNTSMWVGDPTNMENGLDTVPFRLMKNPVILPGDKTRAYELQEMLQYHQSCESSGRPFTNPFTRDVIAPEDMQPIRYPGFRNYKDTVDTLKYVMPDWQEAPDEPGAPSLEEGMGMTNTIWNDAERKHFLEKHKFETDMMNAKQELFEKNLREKERLKNERKRLSDQRISNEKRLKSSLDSLAKRRIEMENAFKVRTAKPTFCRCCFRCLKPSLLS